MMDSILRVSPRFAPIWQNFLREWEGKGNELPIYLVLSDLARHIAVLSGENAERELQEIFKIVENWHLNGDAYVKEAATVGLLEDLQNTNLVGAERPAKFIKYLGPESKRCWKKVEDIWEKGEIIRDN